ncbi:MAG: class F sortase [Euzebyales bacterium]|nr:class F sortase [Euzebyales bacterium]
MRVPRLGPLPDFEPPPEREAPPQPAEAVEPTAVTIPAIGVETSLVKLGLNPDHTMEVPQDFSLAGWYTGAAQPGQRGPAVIAGHVDSHDGPAVFFRLRELSRGDRIKVARSDGSRVTFRVDGVEQFPKDVFPSGRVYAMTSEPTLRLITCAGDFDTAERSYEDNVVVFASLAG